jgi:enterochelin esterase family protein
VESARLKNRRRVWIFTTGDDDPERPLAVLLDGQFWAESMPVWPALASLTREGKLPPAVYVLIDVIDMAHRNRELPCNPDFWLAVQEELLPLLKNACRLATAPTVRWWRAELWRSLFALCWPQLAAAFWLRA